ncbi:hypothetical protein BC941DRAFT_470705 [Chlamydoabsidia padenii]|nr:hypothetical protein BC941DRAFT_470705 [Chlamydoabsidia padenii]
MYKKKTRPTSFSHADRLCDQLRIEQQQSNLLAAKNFLEAILGTTLCNDLHKELQDGVALCRLINCMKPDTVSSIGRKNIPFVKMANISLFLQGAKDLGLQNSDLFQTVDLYEAKDMTAVINTILTLARICNKDGKLNGILGDQKQPRQQQQPRTSSKPLLTLQGNQNTHRHVKNIFEQNHNLSVGGTSHHHRRSLQDIRTSTLVNSDLGEGLGHTTWKSLLTAPNDKNQQQHSLLTNDSGYGSLSRQRQNSCSTPTQIMDALYDDDNDDNDDENSICMDHDNSTSCHLQVVGGPFIVRKRFSQTSLAEPRRPLPPVKNDSEPVIDTKSMLPPPCPVPSRSTPHTPSFLKSTSDDSMEPSLGKQSTFTENKDVCITPSLTTSTRKNSIGLRNQRRLTVRISLRKRGKQTKHSTHFLLGDCVGKGQFGSVFRALDMQTGEIVAVKRIPIEDTQVEGEIMQEVNLLRGMTCPHIVRYIGFAQDDTFMNIVLEYVENGSLLSTLKAFGSLPENLVASYTYKILKGLEYLHNHDVVHCDLKAANILTTKTGDIKLTDFGVSLNLKIKQEDGKGTPAGTPNWMAPEVIEMKGACPKSDIWSLACTIIELLTGKPPYADLIAMSALYHIVEDDCPPLPPTISKNLRNFMLLCFKKDPACRPTASTLLDHPWLSSIKSESAHPSSPIESTNQTLNETRNDYTEKFSTDGNQQDQDKSNTDDSDDNDETNSQVTILTFSDDLLDLVNQHQTHLFRKSRLETGYAIKRQDIMHVYVKTVPLFVMKDNRNINRSIRPNVYQPWKPPVFPTGAPKPQATHLSTLAPTRPTFPSHSSSNRLQRFFGLRKKDDERQKDKPSMYNMIKATKSVPLLRESQKLREQYSRAYIHPYDNNHWNSLPSPSPSPSSSTSFTEKETSHQHLSPSTAWKISTENRPKRRTKSLQTDKDCIIS